MKINLFKSVLTPAIFLLTCLGYAQAPALGSCSDFVLFTSSGTVTHVGAGSESLTGDIGTNLGASTGFGNVNGNMHDMDAISNQCAADLFSLYNDLNSAAATFFPAPALGSGQVLSPGIYSIASGATINQDLILDAGGDPNAVFIIKINGSLTANPGSSVELINGTQACNVFWKTEGLFDLGTAATMRGTVVINNGAINIAAGANLEGRALAQNGNVMVDDFTASIPFGCGSLPPVGPAIPALNATECFSIFSASGTVLNTGATSAIGDIGSNSGTAVGYNPLLVTGTIHTIPDGTTSACAADLQTFYANLSAMPDDIELLYPSLFGNNLVLTPHKYLLNSATVLTDTLYLNAMNDSDATFIFHINGSLTAGVASKIILLNGAQAQNVFWLTSGNVSIGANSTFRGTIISDNAPINLASGVLLEGRAFTTAGNITTNANTVNMPLGCPWISAPDITSEPSDVSVCTGQSATFSVTATGTNITYQWRRGSTLLVDGPNISGSQSSTLTIDPVSILDEDNDYNCLVEGAYFPDDTSVFVSLSVDASTDIITQPVSQVACEGDSVSFFVESDNAALTYEWHNGSTNLTDGGNISGTSTSVLTFDPVSTADVSSAYYCVLTNSCGVVDTTDIVSLSISSPAVITTQPLTVQTCIGTDAMYVVEASGSNLTYQWMQDSIPYVDNGHITGSTNDTLIFNDIVAEDVAQSDLYVIVTSGCGADTSDMLSLVVVTPAILNFNPVSQSVCEGDSAVFIAYFFGSSVLYQWMQGSDSLTDGGNISGALNDTLVIFPATTADIANDYYLIATSIFCGPVDSTVMVSLDVNEPAIITSQPSDITVCAGDAASFTVGATGSGLTYQWMEGTDPLSDGGNISGSTTSTLTIDPVTVSDAGSIYSVLISGTCTQSLQSVEVVLNEHNPIITSEPADQLICLGDAANFTVTATGTGLSYQWRRGSTLLVDGANISGAQTASLTVSPAGSSDVGTDYNCIVTGICGPQDTSAFVSLLLNYPVITVQPLGVSTCIGGTASFTVVATGTGLSYQWMQGSMSLTDGGPISGTTSSTLTISPVNETHAAGNYYVVVYGACTPNDTSSMFALNVDALPVANAWSNSPVCRFGDLNMIADPMDGATYSWSGPGQYTSVMQNPTISDVSVYHAGVYELTVTKNGCVSAPYKMAVVVDDCENTVWVPEGFSPNGDDINDLLVISGIENYPSNSFTVFNRWGSMVYNGESYANTWDGRATEGLTVGGDDLPVGTYFYVLDLRDGNDPVKGTIYLSK